jgi:SAM-dependent methyltransferase
MTEDQNRLRTTFDGAALLYDQVRPGYPEELFDDMVALSRLPSGGRVLEIGCGTGQATVPLARRGYRVLCVELGENLATVARRNLVPYPRAEVQTGDFEEYPLQEGPSTWPPRPPPSTGWTRPSPTRKWPARSDPGDL